MDLNKLFLSQLRRMLHSIAKFLLLHIKFIMFLASNQLRFIKKKFFFFIFSFTGTRDCSILRTAAPMTTFRHHLEITETEKETEIGKGLRDIVIEIEKEIVIEIEIDLERDRLPQRFREPFFIGLCSLF